MIQVEKDNRNHDSPNRFVEFLHTTTSLLHRSIHRTHLSTNVLQNQLATSNPRQEYKNLPLSLPLLDLKHRRTSNKSLIWDIELWSLLSHRNLC
jgi:hypothetical protein